MKSQHLITILIVCAGLTSMNHKGKSDKIDAFEKSRMQMVDLQIKRRGIRDEEVLRAMRTVPRHKFVPPGLQSDAYTDQPLPIGHNQTISQPYIVAYMTEALHLTGFEKVLEIGTGSGYQAAVLAEIADSVYSIEIIEPLAVQAEKTLKSLGYENVKCRTGDGYGGWPEAAPFDAIIVTAAPPEIPQPLIDQLREKGRLIAPVGKWYQELTLITKINGKPVEQRLIPVRFVPMTGEAQNRGN